MNYSSVSGGVSNGFSNCGGGISNFGTLTLNYSSVYSNTAATSITCGYGGGIYNVLGAIATLNYSSVYSNTAAKGGGGIESSNSATLNINNSVIYGNTASNGNGGGIETFLAGPTSVTNSTISGNSAKNQGGGIDAGSATNLSNVTISNNSAGFSGSFSSAGAGIHVSFGTTNIKNTIIAGNQDNSSASPKNPDCNGTIVSGGNNLLGISAGCIGLTNGTNGDKVGTSGSPLDAKLGLLQNNGGPTLTHALLAGSPAIDAGNLAGCKDNANVLLTVDQRGYPRPANSGSANNCDMGVFEFGSILRFLFLPIILR